MILDDSEHEAESQNAAGRSVIIAGASGYIGTRLLGALAEEEVHVIALVRQRDRIKPELISQMGERLDIVEIDFSVPVNDGVIKHVRSLGKLDGAYYLLHSMSSTTAYASVEHDCAKHFVHFIDQIKCAQIVYLGALKPNVPELSEHLLSREKVYQELLKSRLPVTVLRASIIVGSGSGSFEIVRDLTEKLPIMITPKWVRVECQPIAISNVIYYLKEVVGNTGCIGQDLDIGGEEILQYRELLLKYAKVRGLKRWMIPVPFFSAQLSSHWLHFITATNFTLAKSLVGSLSMKTICKDNRIKQLIPQYLLSYEEAIERALARIAQNRVPSTWYDSLVSGQLTHAQLLNVKVPEHGVLEDRQVETVENRKAAIDKIWSLGGEKGWPSMNWAWKVRGKMDKLVGGIGLRRGRRHPTELNNGDALDFWRVLLADRKEGRLILYAEMKLPGEAWLEFQVVDGQLIQRAVFRPLGLWGRLYWWLTVPVHMVLFPRMARKIARGDATVT